MATPGAESSRPRSRRSRQTSRPRSRRTSGVALEAPNAAAGDARSPTRLAATDRRTALLNAAAALVRAGDMEAVSMESVAEQAHVSRPLVYKHFANRGELLAAVYQREAGLVHRELAAEVTAATTLEDMYRALLQASLRVASERGHVFAALRSAGGRTPELRREQRARDRETVRAFAARAVREHGIDPREATAITAVLLGSLDSVLSYWRRHPTAETAQLLQRLYLGMVRSGYEAAAR